VSAAPRAHGGGDPTRDEVHLHRVAAVGDLGLGAGEFDLQLFRRQVPIEARVQIRQAALEDAQLALGFLGGGRLRGIGSEGGCQWCEREAGGEKQSGDAAHGGSGALAMSPRCPETYQQSFQR
jgi:hypothetical protein